MSHYPEMINRWGRKSLLLSSLLIASLPARSLSQLAIGRNKWVGNVIHTGYSIRSDFATYWNQVTPENDGKWGSVESSPGVYNWAPLDNDYNYALQNGFPFKEHNLIWGSQYPSFITSLDSAQLHQEIVNWIDSCGQRYPDAAYCDVVNEPLHTPLPANFKSALGGNGKTGWDWVVNAFKLARKYWSPNTKLLINEYGVINNSSATTQYIQLIDLLKDSSLVDGIGVQAHSFEVATGGASITTLKTNLDRLAATGLPIYISEFAINDTDDTHQLNDYRSIFPMLYEDPGVKGITLWGYTQNETWERFAYLVRYDGTERPALQWLRTYLAKYLLQPAVISPVDTTGTLRDPVLSWHSSIAASSYRVQVGTDPLVSTVVFDSTTADTVLRTPLLNGNTKYYWHVAAMNASDTGSYSAPVSFTTGLTTAGVLDPAEKPGVFALYQNYPNPFNPTTVIRYRLSDVGEVSLKVYDVLGRVVAVLVDGRQDPGDHSVTFDADRLSGGMYFYELNTGYSMIIKKMLLLK